MGIPRDLPRIHFSANSDLATIIGWPGSGFAIGSLRGFYWRVLFCSTGTWGADSRPWGILECQLKGKQTNSQAKANTILTLKKRSRQTDEKLTVISTASPDFSWAWIGLCWRWGWRRQHGVEEGLPIRSLQGREHWASSVLLESSRFLKGDAAVREWSNSDWELISRDDRPSCAWWCIPINPNPEEEARRASGVQGYPWVYIMFKARLGCTRLFQNKTRHRPFLVQ